MRRRLIISAIGVSVAGAASAADWTLTPSIGLQEIVTDNTFGSSTKRQSDAITQLTPGLSFLAQGAHTDLAFNYQPSISAYIAHPGQDRIDENLSGNGTITPFPNTLDIRVSTFASEGSGNGSYVNPAAGGLVPLNDRVLNYGGIIAPHFQDRFGDIATLDATYTISSSNTSQDGSGGPTPAGVPGNNLPSNFANNLLQQEARLVIGSGDSFGRMSVSANFDHVNGSGSGINNRFDNDSDKLQFQYHITHEYSVTASAGYQKTDYNQTLNQGGYNNTGVTWSIGFDATPNDKTQLSVTYGKQQGAYDFNVQLSYDLAPRTFVSGSYIVNVQNQQQATLNNLQFLAHDTFGNPIDSRTGLPFVTLNQGFGAQNVLSRDKNLRLTATHQFLRSSISVTGYDERRDSLDVGNQGDETWGFQATYSRELSSYLQGSIDASYNNQTSSGNVFGQAGDTRFISADATLSFQINDTITANVVYSLFRRLSNVAGEAELTNEILIGIRKSF